MDTLHKTINSIKPLDARALTEASVRMDNLTKPIGSLGRLETLAIRLAGISGKARPKFPAKAVIVMAADHGIARKGVSAYPPEVTPQMVANFLAGGAAINVLARRSGARVIVVDMGVAVDIPPAEGLLIRKIAYGTHDMSVVPAMSRKQAVQAIETGIEVVRAEHAKGLDLVATGDMGIGNTTPSTAIIATLARRSARDVTGRGTGLDDAAFENKVALIKEALQVNCPDPGDPIDVLAKVGGFEIGGLAGVVLGAASLGIPVLIDGFISTAAALVAGKLCPAAVPYMIAAHKSVEVGHRVALEELGLDPLLDLRLRLGEGTGAAIAMHIIDDATAIMDEMATFAEAQVSTQC